jgi:hypothetical protein
MTPARISEPHERKADWFVLAAVIAMPGPALKLIIRELPDGYSEVSYKESRYGMTVERFNEGKSVKIYAKELKGTDFISLNFYTSSSRDYLKPCEMSQEKVMHFLLNQKSINREQWPWKMYNLRIEDSIRN